jgi:hypothetical protein
MPDGTSYTKGLSHYLYIEVFRKSYQTSTYIRFILLTIVLTSVLFLTSLVNSFQNSWMKARIDTHRKVYEMMTTGYHGDDLAKIQKFKEAKGFIHPEEVMALLDEYNRTYIEIALTPKVPFIGIDYDINDLSLVSGVIIGLLYFAFVYCLTLRLTHLTATFDACGSLPQGPDIDSAKLLIKMDQILTVHRKDRPSYLRWLGFVPRLLYAVPTIVYFCIVVHDGVTIKIALEHLNMPARAIVQMAVAVLFLFGLVVLTWRAYTITRETDRLWEKNYHGTSTGNTARSTSAA